MKAKRRALLAPKRAGVLLALSGGVDSSVSGTLLLKKGFAVKAGFMCNYRDPDPRCSYPTDKKWSKEVAEFLKIPWREFNFEPIYKRKVLDYFYEEYQKGNTPNPDIYCNRFVKFDPFLQEGEKDGFDSVAFGHYARVKKISEKELEKFLKRPLSAREKTGQKRTLLLRGRDRNKDQSYFLAQLTEKQLEKILFPIGGFTKKQVRVLARKFKLPSRERKDSTGICSVGQLDLVEFLKRRIQEKKGPIYEAESGKKVGEHQGIFFYTIGQRKGFGLALGEPRFIVAKNLSQNALVVAAKNSPYLFSSWVRLGPFNFLNGKPKLPYSGDVQVRYRQQALPAALLSSRGGLKIKFKKPIWGATRGQFAVFYGSLSPGAKREVVLGSGIIEQTEGEERALERLVAKSKERRAKNP